MKEYAKVKRSPMDYDPFVILINNYKQTKSFKWINNIGDCFHYRFHDGFFTETGSC